MKFVYISYFFILIILMVGDVDAGSRRIKRQQAPPVANGEFLTQAFQVPIRTLDSVHDLLQITRQRIQASQQAQLSNIFINPQTFPNSFTRFAIRRGPNSNIKGSTQLTANFKGTYSSIPSGLSNCSTATPKPSFESPFYFQTKR